MKRVIILISLLLLMLIGCIKNDNVSEISDNSTQTGEAFFSGKWPADGIVNGESNSKFIHYETIEMNVIFTKGDEKRTISFKKYSTETTFSGSLKGLAVGTWGVEVVLSSSDETLGTKTQSISIVEGVNNVTFLFSQHDYDIGPKNFAEYFKENYIPKYAVGFLRALGIAYLKIEKIEVGLSDGLKSYETFLPMIVMPELKETDSGVATGSAIIGTLTYTYDTGNQITGVNYVNDTGFTSNTVITYDSDYAIQGEETTVNTTSSAFNMTYSYTNGMITEIETPGDTINLEYTDGKITTITEKSDGNSVTTSEQVYTYDSSSGEVAGLVETRYDSNDDDSDTDTTELAYIRTYTFDNSTATPSAIQVVEADHLFNSGASQTAENYNYRYSSSTGYLEEITYEHYSSESGTDYDNDTNSNGVYVDKGERIVFHYSGENVIQVDFYKLTYDYVYASTNYEQYIFEELVSYMKLSYSEETTTDIVVEIR